MDPRILAYNAAGEALQAAVETVRTANDADMPAAEQHFRDAQAEFGRCSTVVATMDAAEAIPTFTARAEPGNPNTVGMDERDVAQYSIMRAIRAQISNDWSDASFEREVSDAIAERQGRAARGFFLPTEVQNRGFANVDLRAMTVGTPANGGNLVATELMSGSFIERLRNRMVVKAAGATFLGGLQGNVAIPRQSGGATYYWVAENGNITSGSTPSVDQVLLTPKTGGAYTDIGRTLINQSSIDVEQFVMRDLATACALGLDLAALHGTAANNQPRGIAATSGIGSVAGGTSGGVMDWADVIDLETAVAAANADVANMAYITNAKVRGALKQKPIVANESRMCWDSSSPSAPLNGYNAFVSNQVSSALTKSATGLSACFFGNWADLLIGNWGTVDVLVDPYTGGIAGTVRVIALQDVDIAVRHAESFSAMLDIIA